MSKTNLLLLLFGIAVTLVVIGVAISMNKPAESEHKEGEAIGNSKPVQRLQITGTGYFGTPKNEPIEIPVFHVKASYWYNCHWKASFTNDNFKTEEDFSEAFDTSQDGYCNHVNYQNLIFDNEQRSVAFARKLRFW